ncbi:hypothetical protein L208DRAFT_1418104 [Tricholoma matsutake]|nr:hypothetical protein L208DRAFT_1418104 [Tricholoma matsutake 945]
MRSPNTILLVLFVLPLLFLTSYSAPVLSHSSVDSLAPRRLNKLWGSVKNKFSRNPAPPLGSVGWIPTPPHKYHPGIVTDRKGDHVAVAQVSHNLPPKYNNQLPTQDIVPSAHLDATSHINTGKPDWFHKSQVRLDKQGRKANFVDRMKLKFQQWKNK